MISQVFTYWLNQVTKIRPEPSVQARILRIFFSTKPNPIAWVWWEKLIIPVIKFFIFLFLTWDITGENSKNSSPDSKKLWLVQPVQRFKSTKFRENWPTLTCYISWQVHAISLIRIPFCRAFSELSKPCIHLVSYACRISCKMLKFRKKFCLTCI